MQFSRYIMQRTSLQMRLKDSNFNIFHPFQRNIWCNISLWKHHHLVSLDEVYFFTKIQASLCLLSSSEKCMGLSGLEPPTSRLSGVRSNRLSYNPIIIRRPPILQCRYQHSTIGRLSLNLRVRYVYGCFPQTHRHRNLFCSSLIILILFKFYFFLFNSVSFSKSFFQTSPKD